MPKDRFKVITAVYLILERDGKVLLLQRANSGYMDGWYSLPAGHHDGGETLSDAMIRETREEIGVTVKKEDLKFTFLLHRPFADDGDRMCVFFSAKAWEEEPTNLEPDKCSELNWFDLSALPQNIVPELREVLAGLSRGDNYGEWDDRTFIK